MAEGHGRLFNTEDALKDDNVSPAKNEAVDEPKLISRHGKEGGTESSEERFEALRYAERYRQKLRRGRGAYAADDTDERVADLRRTEGEAKRAAMEKEHSEAKEHNDRIAELLSRINNRLSADGGAAESAAPPPDSREEDNAVEAESTEPTECATSAHADTSHIITVDAGIRSEILHIDGMTLGAAPNADGAESGAGYSVRGGADGVVFVPLRRQSAPAAECRSDGGAVSSARQAYRPAPSGAECWCESAAETTVRDPYTDVPSDISCPRDDSRDFEAFIYPDPERGFSQDPERGAYGDPEGRVYTDPERGSYGDYERRLYTDPEDRTYTDPERPVCPDPRREEGGLNVQGTLYDIEPAAAYARDVSSPYPEVPAYTGDDGSLAASTDISSPYPEAGTNFIRRQRGADELPAYVPPEAYRARADMRTYPDPEGLTYTDERMREDVSYPDPVSEKTVRERPLTARERRAAKREERRLLRDDALRFAAESERGNFAGADMPDPEHTEYRDAEEREYPDPEPKGRTGDFAYSKYSGDEGVLDGADRGGKSSDTAFSARTLRRFMKRAVALDLKRIDERYSYKLRELKLELRGSELRFADKKDKRARTEREIRSDISALSSERRHEKQRARALGRCCTAAVLTNFATSRIRKKADRYALVELREELLHLLTERYHLDERLVSIYSGADASESYNGRFSAEMKGKKRAHKKQRRLEREITANRVSYAYKKKIYALMDEYVELSGELERISYSLKRERPRGSLKRELNRKRRKLRRKLARISDNIEYYKKRGIERAEDKRVVRRNIILGWIALGALVLGAVLILVFWGDITAFFGAAPSTPSV